MSEPTVEFEHDLGMMMTTHDVARYLRLSEAKVYQMAKEGLLPALHMGKTWRFKRELLDEWIRHEMETSLKASV
jgi:excisionase family DNA binding protein